MGGGHTPLSAARNNRTTQKQHHITNKTIRPGSTTQSKSPFHCVQYGFSPPLRNFTPYHGPKHAEKDQNGAETPRLAAEQPKKFPNVRECVVAYTRWGPLRGRPPVAVLCSLRLRHRRATHPPPTPAPPRRTGDRTRSQRLPPRQYVSDTIETARWQAARSPPRWTDRQRVERRRVSSLCGRSSDPGRGSRPPSSRGAVRCLVVGRLSLDRSPAVWRSLRGHEKTPTGSLRQGSSGRVWIG